MYNSVMKRDKGIILADKNEYLEDNIQAYCSDPQNKKLRELVNERRYNVGETDITYRMIGHWDQYDLLPQGLRQHSGWRKFTFVEMVWLRIVKRLRDFGMPLDKIALTRECILEWNKKDNTYDSFEYYIVKTWKSTLDPYVIVIADGHADIATLPEIKSLSSMIGHRDMLLISLTSVIEEMDEQVGEKQGVFSLTEKHRELLSEIHSEDNNEVSVKVRNGRLIEMETTSTITDPKRAKEIQDRVKEDELYGNVSAQFEKGQQRSVKVTRRKRFKE
jgi:DNA-binding transcriptional MerR regulator